MPRWRPWHSKTVAPGRYVHLSTTRGGRRAGGTFSSMPRLKSIFNEKTTARGEGARGGGVYTPSLPCMAVVLRPWNLTLPKTLKRECRNVLSTAPRAQFPAVLSE